MAEPKQGQEKYVRIELTEEQKKNIKDLTGKDVSTLDLSKSIIVQKASSHAIILC
ncbi:hypothetical protein WME76_06910 [Sorangium sp. So ce119]|uniref:hypothetical protein n=1 Tax=Sorangium sp. So ce119 TaxID=3133279 RepID=UPI003F5F8A6B